MLSGGPLSQLVIYFTTRRHWLKAFFSSYRVCKTSLTNLPSTGSPRPHRPGHLHQCVACASGGQLTRLTGWPPAGPPPSPSPALTGLALVGWRLACHWLSQFHIHLFTLVSPLQFSCWFVARHILYNMLWRYPAITLIFHPPLFC